MKLEFEWRDSVGAIDRGDWERCFQRAGFARSYAYQEAVEASSPAGVRFAHLLVRRDGELLAIIGCFRYELPLDVIATGAVRRVVAALERLWPGLFTINTFFMGQLTAVCDHLYGVDGLDPQEFDEVIAQSDAAVRARARALGCSLTMVKEIPGTELERYAPLLDEHYVIGHSLPNTFLSFDPSRSYAAQIRAKYRNLYNKRTKAFRARGLSWTIVDGPIEAPLAANMGRLYRKVMARSDNQFERLPTAFFRELCGRYQGAFAILCHDGERLVGFSINVDDGELLCGLYLGYDDDEGDGYVYFNLLYKLIEVAQSRGKGRVQFGQTSYEIKSALGAVPSPTYLAVHTRRRLLRLVLGWLKDDLFPRTPFPERRVFASSPARAPAALAIPATEGS